MRAARKPPDGEIPPPRTSASHALPLLVSAALEAEGETLDRRLSRIRRHTPAGGRYTILGEIATGGMARVLRVWDEDLQRELAMKVVSREARAGSSDEERADHERALVRFLDEARITGQLDHPGIVPVHEVAMDDSGRVYFTMPLVRGRTLKRVFELARSEQDGWTLHRALGALHKVCLTLAFAHAKGVVHRDLKPENIMVGPFGEAYVMDWGLALVLGRLERKSIVGTPAYMAPEQAAARLEEVGPQSDVYSLGAILYELLSGSVPHQISVEERRITAGEIEQWAGSLPRPLQEIAQGVPPELLAICEKAMARAPRDRYSSAQDLADDLQAWLEGRVVSAYETGTWARLRKWRSRNRGLALALETLAFVFLASVALSLLQQHFRIRTVEAKNREIGNQSYAANLVAANLGLRALEIQDARRRLEDCARDLRGWEWEHLWMRTDSSSARFSHSGEVQCLAVDPRGRILATGSDDGAVRLLDAKSGAELATPVKHDRPVSAMRYAPNGRFLASASLDGALRLWDPDTGLLLHEFAGFLETSALAIDPTGERVASGDQSGRIAIWTSAEVAPRAVLQSDSVSALDFEPCTRLLLSGHATGHLRRWDPGTCALLKESYLESGPVRAIAVHPLGEWIAVACERAAFLVDPELLTPIRNFEGHEDALTTLAIDPHGQRILTGSTDSTVRLWKASSGAALGIFVGHRDTVNAVAFAADGTHLFSASEDESACMWRTDDQPVLVLEGHQGWVTSLAFRSDGERLVSGSRDGTLRVWDVATGGLRETIAAPSGVDCVAYGPRDVLAFGCEEPVMHVGETSLGIPGTEFAALEVCPGSAAFLPELGRLVSRYRNGTVYVWDLDQHALVFSVPIDDRTNSLAMRPRSASFAAGTQDGSIQLIDARSGRLERTLFGPRNTVGALAFSSDGKRIAAGSIDGMIWIASLEGDEPSRLLDGHERIVSSLAFEPARLDDPGHKPRLVSGSEDGTIRVWNPDAGEALLTLRDHEQGITAVAFSPSGDAIASASKDGTVRIWRTARSLP